MINRVSRGCVAAALGLVVFLGSLSPALAEGENLAPLAITIGSDPGGRIGDFMQRLHQYRSSRAQLRFTGSCDSACTLLLAMPRNQACISNGAVFRFHAPTAGSARVGQMAKSFLMANYPGWVRSWVARNNGLTSQLITMDYSYASKFMRTCNQQASR